jgi:hypothetical protein
MGDPAEAKKRGPKSVVRRDVVRLVTPGTITEENLLEPARASILLGLSRRRASDESFEYGLAAVTWTSDITRGHRVAQRMRVGMSWVNSWYLRDLRSPFGGNLENMGGSPNALVPISNQQLVSPSYTSARKSPTSGYKMVTRGTASASKPSYGARGGADPEPTGFMSPVTYNRKVRPKLGQGTCNPKF